jgi:hypothetical protein
VILPAAGRTVALQPLHPPLSPFKLLFHVVVN